MKEKSKVNKDLCEIKLSDYIGKYDRKIDVDVFKEKQISFMVDSDNRNYEAVIFESHETTNKTISYSIYLKNSDGTISMRDGGELDVRKDKFTIFDLLGMSTFVHSKKSKDIMLIDFKKQAFEAS